MRKRKIWEKSQKKNKILHKRNVKWILKKKLHNFLHIVRRRNIIDAIVKNQ